MVLPGDKLSTSEELLSGEGTFEEEGIIRAARVGNYIVDEKNKKVYFTARKDKTTETHLFQAKLDGTDLKQLTTEPGSHRVRLSPGGSYFTDRFSNVQTPSKQDLYKTDGTFVRNIGESHTPHMEEYIMGKKELFIVPISVLAEKCLFKKWNKYNNFDVFALRKKEEKITIDIKDIDINIV